MKTSRFRYRLRYSLMGLLSLSLASCLSHKNVIRNYPFAQDDSCDCYTKHPLIVVGTNSNYFSKEKAFCTRGNYWMRRDSIAKLDELIYRMEDETHTTDSLKQVLTFVDSVGRKLKKEWTHTYIKTKWQTASDGKEVTILKQKIIYYNRFKSGRKRIGMKKYKHGSLVKSSSKNGYAIP